MTETDLLTQECAQPALVEVSWTETGQECAQHGWHCWHLVVSGVGAGSVQALRTCCWCNEQQTAHHEDAFDQHGVFRPAEMSLLDLAIETAHNGRG